MGPKPTFVKDRQFLNLDFVLLHFHGESPCTCVNQYYIILIKINSIMIKTINTRIFTCQILTSSYQPLRSSNKYCFAYRKFINIRHQIDNRQTISSSDIHDKSLGDLSANLKAEKAENSTQNQPQQSLQFHQLNSKIKHCEKLSDLFYIFQKNNRAMTMQQHLVILQKLVTLDNLKNINPYGAKVDLTPTANFEEKMIKIVLYKFGNIFFKGGYKSIPFNKTIQSEQDKQIKQSLPPEYYIGFINIISKCNNIDVLDYAYRNMIVRIIKEELFINEQPKKQETTFNICQVLGMDDNIRLLTSIFRILNNEQLQSVIPGQESKEFQQLKKIMIKISKNIIEYLHLPMTGFQISNNVLMELIHLYIKIRPEMKLNRNVLKSIIREQLRRLRLQKNSEFLSKQKRANKKRRKQSENQQIIQYCPLSSIKKLLLLQRLLRTHLKQQSLLKQISNFKQSNVIYHQFFVIQHKLHKFIKEELLVSVTSPKLFNLNKHLELVPMLSAHIKYLFENIGLQILVKTQLISLLSEKITIIIKYLKCLNTQISKFKTSDQRNINIEKLEGEIVNLLSIISLRPSLKEHLPLAITTSILQQNILGSIFQDFGNQPRSLQIILIHYLIQNNKQDLLSNIFDIFIKQETDTDTDSNKVSRRIANLIYYYVLMGNQKFVLYCKKQISNNFIKGAIEMAFKKSIKVVLTKIQDLEHPYGFIMNNQPIEILETYLKNKNQQQTEQMMQNIIEIYSQISINNSTFSKKQIDELSNNYPYLIGNQQEPPNTSSIQLGSLNHQQYRKQRKSTNKRVPQYQPNLLVQSRHIKKVIIKKIEEMNGRFQFMAILLQKIYSSKIQKLQEMMGKVIERWIAESNMLHYPGVFSHKHIQSFYYIEKFIQQWHIANNKQVHTIQQKGKVFQRYHIVLQQYEAGLKQKIVTLLQDEVLVQKIKNKIMSQCGGESSDIQWVQNKKDDGLYALVGGEKKMVGFILEKSNNISDDVKPIRNMMYEIRYKSSGVHSFRYLSY